MTCVTSSGSDIRLKLYIQPKASRDCWAGRHGDELKIAITAPPVDGKANAHLQKYLAKSFAVAKSQVIIEKGVLGRHKTVLIIAPKQLPELVKSQLALA
ncbi:DUF167 family protein YggU [Rheinheimera maricola]|uniref:UPF0235 protein I4W93_010120 n=1 Tax=Rheinheimera maricola TaxID=2793282 RepID=A0ABS7X8T0_9GAMM|nr:DUF167 family protein YggU [Rheinheimera maricola]MBZ9611951.1 DUF167 family protein YggU [Rheinheimera maricola]